MSKMFEFYLILTRTTGILHEDLPTFITINLANDQLDAQILIHLFQSSTCFEQYLAHPQEVKLY